MGHQLPVGTKRLLYELLGQAALPPARETRLLTGKSFERKVFIVRLTEGRTVVLRQWPHRQAPEHARALFLEMHGVPAPRFLAGVGRRLAARVRARRAPWRRDRREPGLA
ncbi:MAG: hypothetical protein M5T61_07055 [Acidimicrobiia bacterium]|nr:hypothetical protein [Acidimicrobiia bacterium]